MMIKRICIALMCVVFAFGAAEAQRATQLRINEIMPYNVDNYQDDYGKQSPWVEIFNTSYATVNIGGCYLTDDINNPKKYMIQKGDVLTRIRPRQHIVFWADNNPSHGTFHINFTLSTEKPTWIGLYDSNGKTLIDSVTVPPLGPDMSYGRTLDGADGWTVMDKTTPSTNNKIVTSDEAIERFKEHDPAGVGMSITAMGVVFLGLIMLYGVFHGIGDFSVRMHRRRIQKEFGVSETAASEIAETSGEIYAAIAMALYEMDNEAHDFENTTLTINKVGRTYSPWNSKIYAMRQTPHK